MITVQYFHEEEYINDEYFPGEKAEIFFNNESTSTDILINIIKLLNFAGYPLPSKENIDTLKEELDYQGLLRE